MAKCRQTLNAAGFRLDGCRCSGDEYHLEGPDDPHFDWLNDVARHIFGARRACQHHLPVYIDEFQEFIQEQRRNAIIKDTDFWTLVPGA